MSKNVATRVEAELCSSDSNNISYTKDASFQKARKGKVTGYIFMSSSSVANCNMQEDARGNGNINTGTS